MEYDDKQQEATQETPPSPAKKERSAPRQETPPPSPAKKERSAPTPAAASPPPSPAKSNRAAAAAAPKPSTPSSTPAASTGKYKSMRTYQLKQACAKREIPNFGP